MNGGITGINGNGANIFATRRTQFGDNPFLELLVTQMRTQSPLDPVDNDSFMTQVSQLSSMEQQKELNDSMLALLQFQGAMARLQGLTQGAAMIGREVEYVADEKGSKRIGVAESIRIDDKGSIMVRIGGKDVSLESIVGVRAPKDGGDKGGDGKDKNDNDKNKKA